MESETNSIGLVLVKALILAQEAGASEIGIEHLRAALDYEFPALEAPAMAGPRLPVPRVEMSLSAEAAAAIAPLL